MKNIDLAARISAAKERVSIHEAWGRLGLPHPPPTGKTTVKSPFREDRNPSFSIYLWKGDWQFKDFADGEVGGDVVDFIMLATRCIKRDAIATLLEWAGDREPLGHRKHDGKIILPSAPVATDDHPVTTPDAGETPAIADAPADAPPDDPFKGSHRIIPGSMNAVLVAASRKLPISSTTRLAEAGILRTFDGGQEWILIDGPEMPHEFVTAEFRRYDRAPFRHGAKAHTCKGATKAWPVALSLAMKDPSQTIIIVEGGPDLLAAYALIEHLGRNDCVAVAILGREIKQLIPEAQRVFAGRDVLILPHRDKSKAGEPTDGQDAAVQWARMLLNDCGAADVSMSSLEGLTRPDGQPAKDLCDAIEGGGLKRNAGVLAELLPPAKEQTIETI